MPLPQLEQDIRTELDDNPALEVERLDDPDFGQGEGGEAHTDDEESQEREERRDELDKVLQEMGSDDEMPEPGGYGGGYQDAEKEEMVWGDQTSFYDKLKEQMGEVSLDEQQEQIMEYLIGSLDSDGLLRKTLDDISDELAVRQNLYVSEEEIAHVLQVLQSFDPPGIGAQSLQECLLLQIRRRTPSPLRDQMERVVRDYYDEFKLMHWSRIAQQMGISEEAMQQVQAEILRLNPKPGASMSEIEGRNLQQIVPDFRVDVSESGKVTFELNKGHVPDLYVSESFTDLLNAYQNNSKAMNRRDKEALVYVSEKVNRARNYIEAIKQRRRTLYVTMKTIIELQLPYFQSGDENDLHPMVLKDVATRTGLDISTISRVCNAKYAQTPWGTFRLRHFFSEGVSVGDGKQLSNRSIQAALKELVKNENKHKPLSDDALAESLADAGFPIARRTVAKYREKLGIPSARLRKVL